MAMTIAVTRNLPGRFTGFIKSCMHEVAPGVFATPQMKKSVRERLWQVMMDWSEMIPEDGGVVLFWKNPEAPSGMSIRVLGWPKKDLIEYEGNWLTFQKLTKAHDTEELEKLKKAVEESDDGDDPKLEHFHHQE